MSGAKGKKKGERIKVDDKAGALGNSISITKDKSNNTVTSDSNFSKRYSLRHAPLIAYEFVGSWASGALDPERAAFGDLVTFVKRGVWAMIATFIAYCLLQAPST
ncbi:hypothetical protein JHK85_007179 [Glycine max]|nr:hypothetical protein JHK85_007179 [Glycine max]